MASFLARSLTDANTRDHRHPWHVGRRHRREEKRRAAFDHLRLAAPVAEARDHKVAALEQRRHLRDALPAALRATQCTADEGEACACGCGCGRGRGRGRGCVVCACPRSATGWVGREARGEGWDLTCARSSLNFLSRRADRGTTSLESRDSATTVCFCAGIVAPTRERGSRAAPRSSDVAFEAKACAGWDGQK